MTEAPFKWSYSALDDFSSCKLKYKFKHIDKLPDPSGPAALRGTKLHDALEKSVLTGIVEPMFVAAGQWLHDHIAVIHAHKRKGLETERRWMVNRDWQPVEDRSQQYGIAKLDYYYRRTPTFGIVGDWKSGKIYPKHEKQGRLYAGMAMARYPKITKVEPELVYVDAREIHDGIVYTRAKDYPKIVAEFNKDAYAAETAKAFPPTVTRLCGWCAYSSTKGGPCKAG